MKIYPNPFHSGFNLDYKLSTSTDAVILMTDMNGKEVYRKELPHQAAGSYQLAIDSEQLKAGIYTVTLQTKEQIRREKVTKLK
jgi:hypothetical protein